MLTHGPPHTLEPQGSRTIGKLGRFLECFRGCAVSRNPEELEHWCRDRLGSGPLDAVAPLVAERGEIQKQCPVPPVPERIAAVERCTGVEAIAHFCNNARSNYIPLIVARELC
jgi:hypothetical protein